MVVLDTSVLLLPYEIGPETLPEIKRVLDSLAKANRLRLPGQVAREFASRRPAKIMELFQQINTKKSQTKSIEGGRYPLLEELEEYRAVMDVEAQLRKLIAEYQRLLSTVSEKVRLWEWNDPLSVIYGDIFLPQLVVDIDVDEERITQEMEFRSRHKLPPGYKDSAKSNNAAGDLIIWQTILQMGAESGRDMLFVTADRKSDWWHKSGGEGLYPRFELVEEYRRNSNGASFHATTLSSLLRLVGASEEAVEAVRVEEVASEWSLTRIADDWDTIVYAVSEGNRRTAALLEYAWPVAVDGRIVFIEAKYPFHQKRLNDPDTRNVIEHVLTSFYGRHIHVRVASHEGDVDP